jgi:hypothetical protein
MRGSLLIRYPGDVNNVPASRTTVDLLSSLPSNENTDTSLVS